MGPSQASCVGGAAPHPPLEDSVLQTSWIRKVGGLCLLGGMLFTCVSCGYRSEALDSPRATIAIPFIRGDRDGSLTAALSEAALLQGFRLDRAAPVVLDVEIPPFDTVDIGRIYERTCCGQLTQISVPNEARLSVTATIRGCDRNGRTLFGPFQVRSEINYDFQSDLSQNMTFCAHGITYETLRFGRGQLDFFGAAQDAAVTPLEQKLAVRMMEAVRVAWDCWQSPQAETAEEPLL
ncbi:MAG: hypothetical protein ACOYKZ_02005 [Chlamydiia bacterium]